MNIICIILRSGHISDHIHGIIQLKSHKSRFALCAESQAVIPIGMKTSRHMMFSHMIHRKINCLFQVIINSILTPVCINNDFIQEGSISAFTDIFYNCREQPESIIRTIRRMACFFDIFRIIRRIFMTSIMIKFHKRKPSAIIYLCR